MILLKSVLGTSDSYSVIQIMEGEMSAHSGDVIWATSRLSYVFSDARPIDLKLPAHSSHPQLLSGRKIRPSSVRACLVAGLASLPYRCSAPGLSAHAFAHDSGMSELSIALHGCGSVNPPAMAPTPQRT
jgi:hypothetical protein